MDKCGICLKPAVQLFETGKDGVYACFKCQPLVPEVTIEDNVTSEQNSSNTEEESDIQLYCSICHKSFAKNIQLQNHLRNHRAERRFVCTYCNKAFSQSNNLRAHLRIHTNERPYKCNECGKAFTQVTNLNNHVRLHTGERPFVCPEPGCDKAYAQVTNLNQHRKRHLNGRPVESTYDCTICGEQFQQRNHMYTHRSTSISSSSSSDDEEVDFVEHLIRPRKARIYRNRTDNFTMWDENEFYNRFRLTKRAVNMILSQITMHIHSKTNWNYVVTLEQKLLLTLRFLATNSFLVSVGDFIGIHKSTAGKHIWETLLGIAKLKHLYVRMPSNAQEIAEAKQQFYVITRFPNVIGALDCTHVKIESPGGSEGETFRNRKGFFSFNVQAICNAKLKFSNIVARWPGSVHDARILQNSRIKQRFEMGEFPNCLLVADSGYPITNYCVTPLQEPASNIENLYNESQIRTRNTIERAFGVLKRRFPILSLGI